MEIDPALIVNANTKPQSKGYKDASAPSVATINQSTAPALSASHAAFNAPTSTYLLGSYPGTASSASGHAYAPPINAPTHPAHPTHPARAPSPSWHPTSAPVPRGYSFANMPARGSANVTVTANGQVRTVAQPTSDRNPIGVSHGADGSHDRERHEGRDDGREGLSASQRAFDIQQQQDLQEEEALQQKILALQQQRLQRQSVYAAQQEAQSNRGPSANSGLIDLSSADSGDEDEKNSTSAEVTERELAQRRDRGLENAVTTEPPLGCLLSAAGGLVPNYKLDPTVQGDYSAAVEAVYKSRGRADNSVGKNTDTVIFTVEMTEITEKY